MTNDFMRGADVSFLDEIEVKGGQFFDGGQEGDCLAILKQNGMNAIRLRVWNNPEDGFCSVENTLKMARRLKSLGYVVGIDFHYSDWWADPGKQYKPKAWESLSFDGLVQHVYDFTYTTLQQLKEQGTPADFVQVGNEVTYGFLWEDGRVPHPSEPEDQAAWDRFCELLQAGIRATKDVHGTDVEIMMHIDRGGDNLGARFFLDHVLERDIEFDSIGLSFYPWWHGSIETFENNINDLADRYEKDLVLVETAYPWTDVEFENVVEEYTPSPEAQAAFLQTVMDIVRNVRGGRGKGVYYWEPDAITVGEAPKGWARLGLFDKEGNSLPGLKAFRP